MKIKSYVIYRSILYSCYKIYTKTKTKKLYQCSYFFFFFSLFVKVLAHLAKGNVSFCHHLASVVCRPLTFHILIFSSEIPQPLTNMATTGNSCFWLAYFFKSSPLKPLGQMNWILVGSIYGRFSIKIAHFVPIH